MKFVHNEHCDSIVLSKQDKQLREHWHDEPLAKVPLMQRKADMIDRVKVVETTLVVVGTPKVVTVGVMISV